MKVKDVPQDYGCLTTRNMKELCYAVDKEGNYTTKLSIGWTPKTIALNKSLELIDERAQDFKSLYLKGELSTIPYYMELNRMDIGILSNYMKKWKWKIKRHFKPSVFNKLSKKTLQKYANTFNISIAQLKDITI